MATVTEEYRKSSLSRIFATLNKYFNKEYSPEQISQCAVKLEQAVYDEDSTDVGYRTLLQKKLQEVSKKAKEASYEEETENVVQTKDPLMDYVPMDFVDSPEIKAAYGLTGERWAGEIKRQQDAGGPKETWSVSKKEIGADTSDKAYHQRGYGNEQPQAYAKPAVQREQYATAQGYGAKQGATSQYFSQETLVNQHYPPSNTKSAANMSHYQGQPSYPGAHGMGTLNLQTPHEAQSIHKPNKGPQRQEESGPGLTQQGMSLGQKKPIQHAALPMQRPQAVQTPMVNPQPQRQHHMQRMQQMSPPQQQMPHPNPQMPHQQQMPHPNPQMPHPNPQMPHPNPQMPHPNPQMPHQQQMPHPNLQMPHQQQMLHPNQQMSQQYYPHMNIEQPCSQKKRLDVPYYSSYPPPQPQPVYQETYPVNAPQYDLNSQFTNLGRSRLGHFVQRAQVYAQTQRPQYREAPKPYQDQSSGSKKPMYYLGKLKQSDGSTAPPQHAQEGYYTNNAARQLPEGYMNPDERQVYAAQDYQRAANNAQYQRNYVNQNKYYGQSYPASVPQEQIMNPYQQEVLKRFKGYDTRAYQHYPPGYVNYMAYKNGMNQNYVSQGRYPYGQPQQTTSENPYVNKLNYEQYGQYKSYQPQQPKKQEEYAAKQYEQGSPQHAQRKRENPYSTEFSEKEIDREYNVLHSQSSYPSVHSRQAPFDRHFHDQEKIIREAQKLPTSSAQKIDLVQPMIQNESAREGEPRAEYAHQKDLEVIKEKINLIIKSMPRVNALLESYNQYNPSSPLYTTIINLKSKVLEINEQLKKERCSYSLEEVSMISHRMKINCKKILEELRAAKEAIINTQRESEKSEPVKKTEVKEEMPEIKTTQEDTEEQREMAKKQKQKVLPPHYVRPEKSIQEKNRESVQVRRERYKQFIEQYKLDSINMYSQEKIKSMFKRYRKMRRDEKPMEKEETKKSLKELSHPQNFDFSACTEENRCSLCKIKLEPNEELVPCPDTVEEVLRLVSMKTC